MNFLHMKHQVGPRDLKFGIQDSNILYFHGQVIKRHQGTKMHQQALKCLGCLGLKGAFW